MPYHNGKRVSNEEWRRLRGDQTLSWQEASGYGSAEEAPAEPVEAEPKVRKRRGTKKADAEAAVAAITGLDIDLGDEEESE